MGIKEEYFQAEYPAEDQEGKHLPCPLKDDTRWLMQGACRIAKYRLAQ